MHYSPVCALSRRSCIIVIGGETAARYPRTRSPAKILRLKDCADSFFLDRMNRWIRDEGGNDYKIYIYIYEIRIFASMIEK